MRLRLDDWTCAKIDSDRPCLGCDGYINSISIRSPRRLFCALGQLFYVYIYPSWLSEWVCVSTHSLGSIFYPLEVQLRAFLVGARTVCVRIFWATSFADAQEREPSRERPSDSSWAKFWCTGKRASSRVNVRSWCCCLHTACGECSERNSLRVWRRARTYKWKYWTSLTTKLFLWLDLFWFPLCLRKMLVSSESAEFFKLSVPLPCCGK